MKSGDSAVLILGVFFLGFTGWVCETINESITRKRFVNKGFFKGPFIPCQGIGGVCVYALGSFFKPYPAAVFLIGAVLCTALEYATALFLERCFKVKCWDYTTYSHTKWCHYKGRIALTVSFFFGFATLFVVYWYWDFMMTLAAYAGNYLLLIDGIFIVLFLIDAVYSCATVLRYKKAGIPVKGWAVFQAQRTEHEKQSALS
jgi:uncharacterized membrane protein